jgi:histone H3/H4
MQKTQMLLKSTAARRIVGDYQVSDDALEVLERHIQGILEAAVRSTRDEGRRRIDHVTMRRCLP